MQQHLPHRPPYLSQADFDFIIDRDQRRCALHGHCPHAGANECCDDQLDFDHNHPRELGGDDTVGNIRLLCSSRNRGRPVEPLKKWGDVNYWDSPVAPGKLREVQRLAGWDAINDLQHEIETPAHFRRVLLGNTTFLAGATGTGKMILCQSVFFRLNALIGASAPRIKHVLYLTNDTTLRDTGRIELETDTVDILFATAGPDVQVAQGFDDISAGPNNADIIISAAQSLWLVKTPDGEVRRTDKEIRNALLQYDTVVFDECDWGSDQMRHIAQLGSHLLQFALTASPPIDEIAGSRQKAEEFLKRFVLIGEKAVADYARAVELDSCLKLIGDEIMVAAKHGGYQDRERGKLIDHSGEQMKPDHVLFRAAIQQAVVHADQLETRMQASAPDDWYSPHIMVRLTYVADIKAMYGDLIEQLEAMYARSQIRNPGWSVSIIFAGHTREKDKVTPAEYDLSAKDRHGHWRHPFMMARNNNGRAVKDSKRILLMCNIGLRGINNWVVSHIVDCTNKMSPTELIQFNEGRPLRWKDRPHWLDEDSEMAEFAQTRVFIPTSDFHNDKKAALIKSISFIKEMLPRISGAGFLTWRDLLQGRRTSDADVRIDATNRPLTDEERFQVQACIGTALAATNQREVPPSPEEIRQLVEVAIDQDGELRHTKNSLRDRLIDYGQRLLERPGFRQRELTSEPLLAEFKQRPASVMEKLKPQDHYEIDDLIRWVKQDPSYDGFREDYLQELADQKRTAIHGVSKSLRDAQIANYRPAARTRTLQGLGGDPGVLPEVGRELHDKLKNARQPCEMGKVYEAINHAANDIFQIRAHNGGPMDFPAYHTAILGRYRDPLQSIARAKLIADNELGPHLKWVADL